MISPGIRMLLGGGRENFNEFFAENFARFFSNRAALKAFDPMMYYFLSMLTGEDAVASLGLDFAKQRPELTHKIMTLADEQQLALAVDNMMSQRQVYAFMSFAPESLERRILEVCRDSFKDLPDSPSNAARKWMMFDAVLQDLSNALPQPGAVKREFWEMTSQEFEALAKAGTINPIGPTRESIKAVGAGERPAAMIKESEFGLIIHSINLRVKELPQMPFETERVFGVYRSGNERAFERLSSVRQRMKERYEAGAIGPNDWPAQILFLHVEQRRALGVREADIAAFLDKLYGYDVVHAQAVAEGKTIEPAVRGSAATAPVSEKARNVYEFLASEHNVIEPFNKLNDAEKRELAEAIAKANNPQEISGLIRGFFSGKGRVATDEQITRFMVLWQGGEAPRGVGRQFTDTWRGIPVHEVKNILYPAPGFETEMVSLLLDQFPDVTDVHLVDTCQQYSAQRVTDQYQKDLARFGQPVMQSPQNSNDPIVIVFQGGVRVLRVHLHIRDFREVRALKGLEGGSDLTLAQKPGMAEGNKKDQRPEYWASVTALTRAGGYILAQHILGPPDRHGLEIVDQKITSKWISDDPQARARAMDDDHYTLNGWRAFRNIASEGTAQQAVQPAAGGATQQARAAAGAAVVVFAQRKSAARQGIEKDISAGQDAIREAVQEFIINPEDSQSQIVDIIMVLMAGQPLALNFEKFKNQADSYGTIRGWLDQLTPAIARAFEGHSVLKDKNIYKEWIITELIKNAVAHGNRLRLDVPIFIRLDLADRRVVVYDAALDPKDNPRYDQDRKAAFLVMYGVGMGVGSISQYSSSYNLLPIFDDSGNKVAAKAVVYWKTSGSPDSSLDAIPKTQPGGDKLSGIDLRALPIVTQPVASSQFIGRKVTVTKDVTATFLTGVNLDNEWQQVEKMLEVGIRPSTERIKDYAYTCSLNSNNSQDIDKVLSCIADILRQEEETCCETEDSLRQMLVLLESDQPFAKLPGLINSIQVMPKEPKIKLEL